MVRFDWDVEQPVVHQRDRRPTVTAAIEGARARPSWPICRRKSTI
ncbi:hypothetical protein C357_19381 [Citreicella sp. 357]|nr:hypothetical protein C357_19381 [Citreicella sp. 357]